MAAEAKLGGYKACFATCSLAPGTSLSLQRKLNAIASTGFTGIELNFDDLLNGISQLQGQEVKEDDFETIVQVAPGVKKWCDELGLKIVVLQPFSNFEGWPSGSKERGEALKKAKDWIRVMDAVGVDMLQVGSTDSLDITDNERDIAADLATLADMLAEKGFRLSYENWCWGSEVYTWNQAWEMVKKVDRPNMGLCLDTFQVAGSAYADPTSRSGYIEAEGANLKMLREHLNTDLEKLVKEVPAHKIYYLQISDALKMDPPLDDKLDDTLTRPRGRWSHSNRPLPYGDGYIPVTEIMRAFLRTGFKGYLSIETFDPRLARPDAPEAEARRAMDALQKLVADSTASSNTLVK